MHRKPQQRIAVVVALVLMATSMQITPTQAWWDGGHMMVAQIALNALDAETQSELHNLTSMLPTVAKSGMFVESACWMDDIKSQHVFLYNNWHFYDQPLVNSSSLNPSLPPQEGHLWWAISGLVAQIKSGTTCVLSRALALRQLLHLVGDAHQPLHSVALFDAAFPQGDRGGNLFHIGAPSFDPSINNLHKLWDSTMGVVAEPTRPLSVADAKAFSTLADQLVQQVDPQRTFPPNWQYVNTTRWGEEAMHLARTRVYEGIEVGQTPTQAYLDRGKDTIRYQLVLAGMRLAEVLKDMPTVTWCGVLPVDETDRVSQLTAEVASLKTKLTTAQFMVVGYSSGLILAILLLLGLALFSLLYIRRIQRRAHTQHTDYVHQRDF